jgi:GntR family transcriptional regulator
MLAVKPAFRPAAALRAGAPLYKEVRRALLECLATGEWKPGMRLPSEGGLARRFGVGIYTIRAAVDELAKTGVLIRRQGKGTYVARHDVDAQGFRYSHLYRDGGEQMVTTREILSVRKTLAEEADAQTLGLPAGEKVFEVRATLSVDNRPIALMELLLPCNLFRGLTEKMLRQTDENLYAVYQNRFGITVLRMDERVRAKPLTTSLARLLRMRGGAVLDVERVAYTFNDRAMEIRRRTYAADGVHYLLSQQRVD